MTIIFTTPVRSALPKAVSRAGHVASNRTPRRVTLRCRWTLAKGGSGLVAQWAEEVRRRLISARPCRVSHACADAPFGPALRRCVLT